LLDLRSLQLQLRREHVGDGGRCSPRTTRPQKNASPWPNRTSTGRWRTSFCLVTAPRSAARRARDLEFAGALTAAADSTLLPRKIWGLRPQFRGRLRGHALRDGRKGWGGEPPGGTEWQGHGAALIGQ